MVLIAQDAARMIQLSGVEAFKSIDPPLSVSHSLGGCKINFQKGNVQGHDIHGNREGLNMDGWPVAPGDRLVDVATKSTRQMSLISINDYGVFVGGRDRENGG